MPELNECTCIGFWLDVEHHELCDLRKNELGSPWNLKLKMITPEQLRRAKGIFQDGSKWNE